MPVYTNKVVNQAGVKLFDCITATIVCCEIKQLLVDNGDLTQYTSKSREQFLTEIEAATCRLYAVSGDRDIPSHLFANVRVKDR